jgi:sulfonate transport system substrate-binding protein
VIAAAFTHADIAHMVGATRDAATTDVKVLQNLGRMKEFDPKKWVDDSFIRKAYAEMKLDYDAQLGSTKNYEISRDDTFCKKPIADPCKASEVWVDEAGILPFASAACTLGAYADLKTRGKKINVAMSSTPRGGSARACSLRLAGPQGHDSTGKPHY